MSSNVSRTAYLPTGCTSRICTACLPPTVRRSLGECPCTSALGLRTRRYSAARSKLSPLSKATLSALRSLCNRSSVGQEVVTSNCPSSIKRNVTVLDDFLPLRVFVLGEGGALVQAGAARGQAELGEGCYELTVPKRLVDGAVELGEDLRRCSSGAVKAKPEVDAVSGQARLGHRRQIGIDRGARRAGGGERNDAVIAGERQRAGDAGKRHLDFVAPHIGEGIV